MVKIILRDNDPVKFIDIYKKEMEEKGKKKNDDQIVKYIKFSFISGNDK